MRLLIWTSALLLVSAGVLLIGYLLRWWPAVRFPTQLGLNEWVGVVSLVVPQLSLVKLAILWKPRQSCVAGQPQ